MKTLLIGLALSCLSGAAAAQDAPPPRGPGGGMMMRADTNGDGVVTRDEAIAQTAERFDRMDVDHDGRLTREELGRAAYGFGARTGPMPPAPPAPPAPPPAQ